MPPEGTPLDYDAADGLPAGPALASPMPPMPAVLAHGMPVRADGMLAAAPAAAAIVRALVLDRAEAMEGAVRVIGDGGRCERGGDREELILRVEGVVEIVHGLLRLICRCRAWYVARARWEP